MARHVLFLCLAASALALAGCYTFGDYAAAANGDVVKDLRDITVDPAAYHSYAFAEKFTPPRDVVFPSLEECIEKVTAVGFRTTAEQIRADCTHEMNGPDWLGVAAMPDVETVDVWQVRYVVDRYYVISSDSYDRRYCDVYRSALPTDKRPYPCQELQNLLFVDSSGHVASGWQVKTRPDARRKSLLDSGRISFDLNPGIAKLWSGAPPLRVLTTHAG